MLRKGLGLAEDILEAEEIDVGEPDHRVRQCHFAALSLRPHNPFQTAPEQRDGLICCLLILGLSARRQMHLRRKSVFLTLSTRIYATFLITAPVTNAKGLLKVCLNANVFRVQNRAEWGGGE